DRRGNLLGDDDHPGGDHHALPAAIHQERIPGRIGQGIKPVQECRRLRHSGIKLASCRIRYFSHNAKGGKFMRIEHKMANELVESYVSGGVSRREMLQKAGLMGLSVPVLTAALGARGAFAQSTPAASADASPAAD